MTGRVPFDGDTPVSVAMKHIQRPNSAHADKFKCFSDMENIILKAIAKEPQTATKAFQDCADIQKVSRVKMCKNIYYQRIRL